jgi:hypothetical protein
MEPWPPFHDRKQWYKTKLLAMQGRPYESPQPQSHRDICNKAYKRAGATLLRGTHTGRREGCKLADMLDVPDAQMRRLGRWDHSRMTQHYLTGLAREGARMIAGHGKDEGMSYLSHLTMLSC